jgi:hypothetical protein
MEKKFEGTIEDLKAVVEKTGINGHWVDEGEFHVFHSDEGPNLNWWPNKNILMLQGSPAAKKHFEQLFDSVREKASSYDADLQSIIDAWPNLPVAIRSGILAMINATNS